jgi:hypothetical protein
VRFSIEVEDCRQWPGDEPPQAYLVTVHTDGHTVKHFYAPQVVEGALNDIREGRPSPLLKLIVAGFDRRTQ